MTSPSSAESAPTTSKSETPEAGPLQTLRDRLFRGVGQMDETAGYVASLSIDRL